MTPLVRLVLAVLVGCAVVCWLGAAALARRSRAPVAGAARRPGEGPGGGPADWSDGRRGDLLGDPGAWPDAWACDGPGPGAGDRLARSHRKSTRRPRSASSTGDVAAACELVALALSAGVGVDEGLSGVAAVSPVDVRAALRTIVAARQWGLDVDLETRSGHPGSTVAARSPTPGNADPGTELASWSPLVRALRMADAAGIPPAGPLRRAAEDLRARRRHRLEVATARLRVHVVLPLGLCFLPSFVMTTVVPVVLALAARVSTP